MQQQLVKRDKAIAQLMTRLATMRTNLIYLDKQIESDEILTKELKTKENSLKRLTDKKD